MFFRFLFWIIILSSAVYFLAKDGEYISMQMAGYWIEIHSAVAFLILFAGFLCVHVVFNIAWAVLNFPKKLKSYWKRRAQENLNTELLKFIISYASHNTANLPSLYNKIKSRKELISHEELFLLALSDDSQVDSVVKKLTTYDMPKELKYWALGKKIEKQLLGKNTNNLLAMSEEMWELYQNKYSAELKIKVLQKEGIAEDLFNFLNSFRVRMLLDADARKELLDAMVKTS